MISIGLELDGLDAAVRRWKRRARNIKRDAVYVVHKAGPDMVDDVQAVTPVRTGELRGSWAAHRTSDGVDIRNRLTWAGFVIRGPLASRVRAELIGRIGTLQPALVKRLTRGA